MMTKKKNVLGSLSDHLPLKQGLKLDVYDLKEKIETAFRSSSIKTRIETRRRTSAPAGAA